MKLLLSAEGVLTPSCSKSHISYAFSTSDHIKGIKISFEYEPKTLQDLDLAKSIVMTTLDQCGINKEDDGDWHKYLPLKNLLTLSVDDPNGFRGAAHRQPNKQELYINAESASPGFSKGETPSGQWKVTISAHALITEKCTYKLNVSEVSYNE